MTEFEKSIVKINKLERENVSLRSTVEQLKAALKEIKNVLGPKPIYHGCEGCYEEMQIALDVTREALGEGGGKRETKDEPTEKQLELKRNCVCGEWSSHDLVVHRTDGPCYLREKP